MSPINRYWTLVLRRDGCPIPRWQQATHEWKEGLFTMTQERDALTGRTSMVARLKGVSREMDLRPPLRDAHICLWDHERIVVTGMERDETTRKDVAQAWLLVAGRSEPTGTGALDAH